MTTTTREFPPLNWKHESPGVLLARIREAGIVGMGGAGFPTHLKFRAALNTECRTVVANGVETDPGVSADKTLLRQNGKDVLEGIGIAARILNASSCFLAVSEQSIANQLRSDTALDIDIVEVENTYQNGEERVLIEKLLGKRIAPDVYPANQGIVVLNVATLFAICECVRDGMPVTKRLATILGEDQWCEIGTAVHDLATDADDLRVGSFANGRPADNTVTLQPIHNAVLIDRARNALPCIRCGWCDTACPKQLPVERLLNEATRSLSAVDSLKHLNDCNDCGACVVSCPSGIPIIDYIRDSRARENNSRTDETRARAALTRFEAKQRRINASKQRTLDDRERRMQQDHKW